MGEFPLYDSDGGPIELLKVQGGDLSPAGHLLLLVQSGSSSHGSGVYVFDSDTGRLMTVFPIDPVGDEFEGMNVHRGFSSDGHVQVMDSDKRVYPLTLDDPTVFFP